MGDRNYEMYVEKKNARAEGHAEGRAEGKAEGREEGISILESLGAPKELIEKARQQIAEAQARLAELSSK